MLPRPFEYGLVPRKFHSELQTFNALFSLLQHFFLVET
jgi:hypothetical protein